MEPPEETREERMRRRASELNSQATLNRKLMGLDTTTDLSTSPQEEGRVLGFIAGAAVSVLTAVTFVFLQTRK